MLDLTHTQWDQRQCRIVCTTHSHAVTTNRARHANRALRLRCPILAGMTDDRHRYWPRQFDEIEGNGVSLINEPIRNAIPLRPVQRPLHAVLVEALTNTQALLSRLEAGVHVPKAEQREAVRELYVAARRQAKALSATLELDGLE